jgi:hypothetical protein
LEDAYADDTTQIQFESANLALNHNRQQGHRSCQCDYAISTPEIGPAHIETLQYSLYIMPTNGACGSAFSRKFQEDVMFESLDKMATVEGILKYGTRVGNKLSASDSRLYSRDTTPGVGMIYNVIVTDAQYENFERQNLNQVTEDCQNALAA